MGVDNNSTFLAVLITIGRVSGKMHSKTLKAVKYNGRIYFSRHLPDSDWFKNAIKNPVVAVEIDGKKSKGIATIIRNDALLQKISELKYPHQEKAKEKRVAIQIILCELP